MLDVPLHATQAPGLQQLPAQVYSLPDYVLSIGLSTVIGIVLAVVYRHTHKGLSYSQAFTQTILLVCVIVTIVMMAIANELARALALVGALSIIRFRTVVKDTRDTAFVFAALILPSLGRRLIARRPAQ